MTAASGKIFHSNENYAVTVNDGGSAYNVTNSQSGVVEFRSDSLPECIFAAENMNVVLTRKTYEWIEKRARDQALKDAGVSLKSASVTELN